MSISISVVARIFAIAVFSLLVSLSASIAYAQDAPAERTVESAPTPAPAPAPVSEPTPAPAPAPAADSSSASQPAPAAEQFAPDFRREPINPMPPIRRDDFPGGEQGRGAPPPEFRGSERGFDRGPSSGGGGGEMDRGRGENRGWGGEMDRGRDDRGGEEMDRGEEQERRQAEMDIRRAKQMAQGIERGIKNIARSITRIKKQGGTVPPEYESTVSELTAAIATVKSATEMNDAAEAALMTLEEKGEDIREMGPRLGMLEQFPRIIKEATKQITQAKKQLAKSVARAKAAGIDVSEIKASIESKLAAIEQSIAEAKASSDPEEAMESLRENAFEATEDVRDEMMVLENIANASRMIKDADKEIARIEKAGAQVKKKGKDTSTLVQLIAEMKSQLAEIKTMMRQSGNDPEDMFEAFSEGERLHNDAVEELARLRGEATDIDKQFKAPDVSKASAGATVYLAYLQLKDALGL